MRNFLIGIGLVILAFLFAAGDGSGWVVTALVFILFASIWVGLVILCFGPPEFLVRVSKKDNNRIK